MVQCSINCYVYGAVLANRAPITNATVSLESYGASVTENHMGVYTLGALPDGNYAVVVSAPGFASSTRQVSLAGGGLAAFSFALTASPGEGEGEGERDGCCDLFSSKQRVGPARLKYGDMSVLAAVAVILVLYGRPGRRGKA